MSNMLILPLLSEELKLKKQLDLCLTVGTQRCCNFVVSPYISGLNHMNADIEISFFKCIAVYFK